MSQRGGVEPRLRSEVYIENIRGKEGRAMNRSYFDVVLVSLIVASCYLFIAPV